MAYGADISSKNIFGRSAIHWAANAGNITALSFIYENYAD